LLESPTEDVDHFSGNLAEPLLRRIAPFPWRDAGWPPYGRYCAKYITKIPCRHCLACAAPSRMSRVTLQAPSFLYATVSTIGHQERAMFWMWPALPRELIGVHMPIAFAGCCWLGLIDSHSVAIAPRAAKLKLGFNATSLA
jgi:hypothetical protein